MARSEDLAVPPGADPALLTRDLHRAHDEFVASGRAHTGLRSLVIDSWQRSLAGGLDPEGDLPRMGIDLDLLDEIRSEHPLALGMPVIRRLLVESATDAGLLVAVSDAAGQLLWVEGASGLRTRAEDMHFMAGADWSEASAGTNAPGTALALDRPVQLLGPEHLARQVTPWSCSAAPIHDPDTGAVLGVLDVTGGVEVASPQSLGLVRATVAAVEAELRIARLSPPQSRQGSSIHITSGWSVPRLDVLGTHGATLHVGAVTSRLSLRHSELLLLLSRASDGLTSAELGLALSDDEQAPVTIRAELSRLRGALGPLELESRPYRLSQVVRSDLEEVREHVRAGRLRSAVAAYRGPVLPASTAPAVEELRDDLHLELRSALLAGADADALLSFADTQHGREDLEVWTRVLEILPFTSPRYAQVEAHVARLDDLYS
ncbi:MAG: transcriptional regulator [Actinomycetales bacterium]|nr:MAG: transcriptional regulator [Actinomycetales bacterium]